MATIQEIKNFFIGDKKFTKSTVDTPVYHNPGEAAFKTVNANDTIGKVEGVNTKGNWLKLRDDQYNPGGGWVLLSDHMYTTILNVEAPASKTNAVTREAEKAVKYVASGVWDAIPTWLKIFLFIVLFVILGAVFFRISGASLPQIKFA